MKILMAASCSSNRNLGVPGVMHSLADEYRALGHEVRMRFRDTPGRVGEMLFGWRLARSQDARWADLVDSHAVEAWPLSGRRHRPAVVARSHGLELGVHRRLMESVRQGQAKISPIYWTYRGSIRLHAEKRSVLTSDASLLLNQSDFDICAKEFRAPSSRLHLVPNGYPSAFLNQPIQQDIKPGVLFLGSWLARKGNDLATRAITTLLRKHPGTPVLLAGTGIDSDAVLADFPEDVRGSVTVLPKFQREDLPGIVKSSTILLFPSRAEGYPLSLVESMAFGIAPLASAIPGVVEVVEDGKSGMLVKSEDVPALESRLLELVASPGILANLRLGARERVRSTSWDQIAGQQLAIYQQAILARSRKS